MPAPMPQAAAWFWNTPTGASCWPSCCWVVRLIGLGDDVTPTAVGFQQSVHSPVDDLKVVGDGPGGSRTLFVGVRRKPSIGASQKPTVKLMADYLRVVNDHGAELEAGSWRLGLAVAAPHTPTDELAKLAYFARRQPDPEAFRMAVTAPKATTGKVRNRLTKVEETVAVAAPLAGISLADTVARDELAWRLLRSLHIIDLRLEGDDAAGRTDLVARLVLLAGKAAAAEDLRRHLNELPAGYAVGAAVVKEGNLRRDLSGPNQRSCLAGVPRIVGGAPVARGFASLPDTPGLDRWAARQPGGAPAACRGTP